MGWRAIDKQGNETFEDRDGRPVQLGEEGNLLVITQEEYHRRVAIDLVNGIIHIDYDSVGVQNGQVEIAGSKISLWICDETNIAGDMYHVEHRLRDHRDEDGKRVLYEGRFVQVRDDILTPLTWRPIWFTRNTVPSDQGPTKVVGAQTTLPKTQGGKNVKKMVSLFPDGRIGID